MQRLLVILSLLSLTLAARFGGWGSLYPVEEYSSSSSSTSECCYPIKSRKFIDCSSECDTKKKVRKHTKHRKKYHCDVQKDQSGYKPCLEHFKQVNHILSTLDSSQHTIIAESFKQMDSKQAAVANAALSELVIQYEEGKTVLERSVIECAEKGLTDSLADASLLIDKEWDGEIVFINNEVSNAETAINTLITALGASADAVVLAAIQTPNSPFQQSVSAAITQISTDNTLFISQLRDRIAKDLNIILTKYIGKTIGCIKEAFKVFNDAVLSRLRIFIDRLKKQLGDVLKAGELSLIATLTQSNRKVIEGIRYLLGLCASALTVGSCGGTKPPLLVLGQGANPSIN